VQYVKAGRLGRKAGRGVYEYPEQQAATADGNGSEKKSE
jgi:3-hydroxyacyl-CoA dehydrogenase